jgi:hypothetical protein
MEASITGDPLKIARLAIDGLMFAAAASGSAYAWYRKRGSNHWPMTHGTVQFGEVIGVESGPKIKWFVDLSYSYVVDGHYYAGKYRMEALNEDRAYEMSSRLKDQSLAVRYATRDPNISVVLEQDQVSFMGQELGKS